MKIKLLKCFCYADSFWPIGAIIEVDDNTGRYAIGVGDAAQAPEDVDLSPAPDVGPPRQSLESQAMETAAARIVAAVASNAAVANSVAENAPPRRGRPPING